MIWIKKKKKTKICFCQNRNHQDKEDHTVCHTLADLAFSFIVMKLMFLLLELLNSNLSALLPISDWFVASFTCDNHSNKLESAIVLTWLCFPRTVHGNKPGRLNPHDLDNDITEVSTFTTAEDSSKRFIFFQWNEAQRPERWMDFYVNLLSLENKHTVTVSMFP